MKIQASRRIQADAATLWKAWTDPDELARWYVSRAEGRGEAGGTLTWIWHAFGYSFPLEVEVADAPRRMVLTAAPRPDRAAHRRSPRLDAERRPPATRALNRAEVPQPETRQMPAHRARSPASGGAGQA